MCNTGSPSGWLASGAGRRLRREARSRPLGVADGVVVPTRPGNAGGGKDPWSGNGAGRSERQAIDALRLATPITVEELRKAPHAKAKERVEHVSTNWRQRRCGIGGSQHAGGALDRERPRRWLCWRHTMGGTGTHREPDDERPTIRCASCARLCRRATLRGRRHDPGESRMREIRTSGSPSGDWKRSGYKSDHAGPPSRQSSTPPNKWNGTSICRIM